MADEGRVFPTNPYVLDHFCIHISVLFSRKEILSVVSADITLKKSREILAMF